MSARVAVTGIGGVFFRARDPVARAAAVLDAMLAPLRAAGAQVDHTVESFDHGRFGWATAPEGNRCELRQPPAGASPVA